MRRLAWISALLVIILISTATTLEAQDENEAGPITAIYDTEGVNIWPMIQRIAAANHIPPQLLLAIAKAESGLNPHAENPHDPSYGMTQVLLSTAGRWGVGDKTRSKANVAFVRAWLFERENALDLAARIAAYLYEKTRGAERGRVFMTLVAYNCGHFPAANAVYWKRWAGNVRRINAAIAWAYDTTARLVEVPARGLLE